jgi:hypothetical protein
MYSLPLKLTADFGAPNGSAYFFNVNPVTVGDWNLISRALIPLWVCVDGFIEGTPDIHQGRPSPSKTIRSVRHRRPSTWIRCWRR